MHFSRSTRKSKIWTAIHCIGGCARDGDPARHCKFKGRRPGYAAWVARRKRKLHRQGKQASCSTWASGPCRSSKQGQKAYYATTQTPCQHNSHVRQAATTLQSIQHTLKINVCREIEISSSTHRGDNVCLWLHFSTDRTQGRYDQRRGKCHHWQFSNSARLAGPESAGRSKPRKLSLPLFRLVFFPVFSGTRPVVPRTFGPSAFSFSFLSFAFPVFSLTFLRVLWTRLPTPLTLLSPSSFSSCFLDLSSMALSSEKYMGRHRALVIWVHHSRCSPLFCRRLYRYQASCKKVWQLREVSSLQQVQSTGQKGQLFVVSALRIQAKLQTKLVKGEEFHPAAQWLLTKLLIVHQPVLWQLFQRLLHQHLEDRTGLFLGFLSQWSYQGWGGWASFASLTPAARWPLPFLLLSAFLWFALGALLRLLLLLLDLRCHGLSQHRAYLRGSAALRGFLLPLVVGDGDHLCFHRSLTLWERQW